MKNLHDLLAALGARESLDSLALTLAADDRARIHAAPALGAARPAIVASIASALRRPVVYVVQTSDAALRALEDLRAWLGHDAAMLFPAADALPYEHMSPGPDVLAARLRLLRGLDGGELAGPLALVVPMKALTQPTLTRDELAETTLTLRRGDERGPDALMERWVQLGYRPAPTVEEPGEVNRRGGILDIFPPGDAQPLRIEFVGDEIESLRRYDPLTQRSDSQVDVALVGPPHEYPLWNRDLALDRIRHLDVSGLRREALDEWMAALYRLETGERFEGRALYAPFYRPDPARPASLLSHLPRGTPLIFSEMVALARYADDAHRQAETRRAAQVSNGELPQGFLRPYLVWGELAAQMADLALLDLSNNDALGTGEAGVTTVVTPTTMGLLPTALPERLFAPADLFGGRLRDVVADIAERLERGERVAVVSPQAARIQELVGERFAAQGDDDGAGGGEVPDELMLFVHGALDEGWRSRDLNLTLYTDAEIFGLRQRRSSSEKRKQRDKAIEERAAFLRGLKVGDFVVHIEHGIAVYDGLVRRKVGSIEREYLNLRYADGDKLYVPIDQVDRVSRYIGVGDAEPQLTRLGTQDWERAKRKARQAVQDLADDLIKLYAARQMSEGHAFAPDNEWQRELEASFPYTETPDQLKAIVDVKHDMEQTQPMDRLVCGDVGFGKTEVALRAAFKAVQDGKQVAVLVPTTVLAQQHFDTFSRRMAAFPLKIAMISRYRSVKEQAEITRQIASGAIDILIGTHRLLSSDIHFKDLGLLIVDEEQRFGVRHKERVKQMRANVDVLTLTATPIPRTLHMALAGIRDLSVIDTPPEDRLPVKTYVLPYDDGLVREAIQRELERGGQVYFVHNRVHSIYYTADRLRQLVPDAEIGVGHGQLDDRQLEKVMLDFFTGKDDVLVCTTIIESGLDVPNANTIIIDDATNYGLAQLYQLRGRVGRSTQRAYGYLFYKSDRPSTPEAQERLQAIQEATELGAGLQIAMRDLEIRGAGNLLGPEQSGQIAAVGFDLYSRLLGQAVTQLKAQMAEEQKSEARSQKPEGQAPSVQGTKPPSPPVAKVKVDEKVLISPLVTLDLPLDAYLPMDYIVDDQVRLGVYQRLATAQTPEQVRDLRAELRDRFGEPPTPTQHLLTWLLIKSLALKAGVTSVVTSDEEFIIRLPEGGLRDKERLTRRFGRNAAVKIGPQFIRVDRRSYNFNGDMKWVGIVTDVLEVLAATDAGQPGQLSTDRHR